MIKSLGHIAIVVKNIDETLRDYERLFGFKAAKVTTLPEQGVKAALIPVADGEIELLEPVDPQGGVAKFLGQRGEGLHHFCLEVEDIGKALSSLQAKGVKAIDQKPRKGLAGMVGFLHPSSCRGVLIELAQKVKGHG